MRQLLGAIVVLAATPVYAAEVSWNAPADCPEQAVLHEEIEKRLDAPLASVALDVDASVEAQPDGFVAYVRVRGEVDDVRTLTSTDCRELTEAVALVIARLATSRTPPRAAPPVPVTPAVPAVPAVRDRAAPPARASRWNGGLRVAGLLGAGTAPGVGVAAELGAWVAWRQWGLVVSGSQWQERTVTLDDTMAGAEIGLRALSLRAGWRPDEAPWRTWLVAQWGTIRGEGVELDESRSGTARWRAAGVGAGWALPITARVTAVAASEIEFVFDRARFTLDRGTELYRTPPVALQGSVTIEVGLR